MSSIVCCLSVDHEGLKEVGIFRLPGQNKRIQTLKELYDKGMPCGGVCGHHGASQNPFQF